MGAQNFQPASMAVIKTPWTLINRITPPSQIKSNAPNEKCLKQKF